MRTKIAIGAGSALLIGILIVLLWPEPPRPIVRVQPKAKEYSCSMCDLAFALTDRAHDAMMSLRGALICPDCGTMTGSRGFVKDDPSEEDAPPRAVVPVGSIGRMKP